MQLNSLPLGLIPLSDVYYAAWIAFGFIGLLAIAEWWRYRFHVEMEWTRKLVHLGGGLVCLLLPFVIQSHWTVLILAISMGAIFLFSRRWGMLQSIHAIERTSRGTEYYPIVVYLLFLMSQTMPSHEAPWKFVICILVLAMSDSTAALVGMRYGRIKFYIEDEQKSLAGSTAFYVVTLVVVLIPLFIWQPLSGDPSAWLHYVLAVNLIALLVTCFELVSLQGRDNLFVPLGTFLALTKTFQTDVADLIVQNISFAVMLVAILTTGRLSKSFNVGGAVMVVLACYACWAMGSFDWALPIIIGYGAYVVASLVSKLPWQLSVRPVAYLIMPSLSALVIGNIGLNSGRPDWVPFCFGPFLVASVVALSQSGFNAMNWNFRRDIRRKMINAICISVLCWCLLILPLVGLGRMNDPQTILVSLLVVLSFAPISTRVLPPMPPREAPQRWLIARVLVTAVAAIVFAILQWLAVCEIWNPI